MSVLSHIRNLATMTRWLGPWADECSAPDRVRRTIVDVDGDGGVFPAWLYTPVDRATSRAFVIAPGLHMQGPANDRFDRFSRVLAASGAAVLAPFVPDFGRLRVTEQALSDFRAAYERATQLPEVAAAERLVVFSISFGSLLALRLCGGHGQLSRPPDRMIIFGGYCEFDAVAEFCTTGRVDGAAAGDRDPLNQPVVFMNLMDELGVDPADQNELESGWMRYLRATWNRPEMKSPARWRELAQDIGEQLAEHLMPIYRIGCGLEDGGYDTIKRALHARAGATALTDPLVDASRIAWPIDIIHGVDDDVIPHSQADRLAAALAPHTEVAMHKTGLYGHSRQSGGLPDLRSLAGEGKTLFRMMSLLALAR